MTPKIRLLLRSLSFALAAACGDSPPGPTTPTSTLDGEVHLSGLVSSPEALTIEARPLAQSVTPSGGATVAGDASGPTLAATRIEATSDPHVLRFHFDGLAQGKPYQLGIGDRDPTKIAWRAPRRGWVVAGSGASAQIEGFHAGSEIEVLAHRATGDVWVGADEVDLSNSGAPRKLRVRSSIASATEGTLEVSTEPFLAGQGCATPKGLIHTATVSLSRDFAELPPLDVGAIVAAAAKPTPSVPNVPAWHRAVSHGAPLYARVVPLRDKSRACSVDDGEPGTLVLSNLGTAMTPPPIGQTLTFSGTYSPATGVQMPSGAAMCVRVTKAHTLPSVAGAFAALTTDTFAAMTVLQHPDFGGRTMVPGDFFCFPVPDSDGFFGALANSFTTLATGLIDGVAGLVNAVAALWEEIKAVVVNLVADAIGFLGVDCDTTCRAALTMGLNIGLAALGLPPSLPNFDQLSQQGLDYLIAETADQIGVPPEAAKLVVAEVVSKMQQSPPSMGPGADWVAPDDGFRPATIVAKISAGPLVDVPDSMLVISDHLFGIGSVPLPKAPLLGGKTLTIPLVLPLDVTGLAEPPTVTMFGQTYPIVDVALWYHRQWTNAQLFTPCVQGQAWSATDDPLLHFPVPKARVAAFGFMPIWAAELTDGRVCP